MRVLHVVPSFYPAVRYGGPIVSVHALCRALVRAGVEVEVATTDADGPARLDVEHGRFVDVQGVPVRYFARPAPLAFTMSAELADWLPRHVRDYDLVHVTSTFSHPSLVAGHAAREGRVPYVISPRGSLQRWSLGQKTWKKEPYFRLVEKANLLGAAAIHVTSDMEADELHAVLPALKTFVVPNGVESPPPLSPAPERVPGRVVFLGRLHPKKGLDILVEAMSLLTRDRPDVELLVAGPDETGEIPRLRAILERLQPRPRVTFVGPVEGEEKWRLLASATVFALSSHGENFGQAVVEALASGTPVVVSRNTPWAVLEQHPRAGAWVENTAENFASALAEVLDVSGRMADRTEAALAVAREFSWDEQGARMAREYRGIVAERGTR